MLEFYMLSNYVINNDKSVEEVNKIFCISKK